MEGIESIEKRLGTTSMEKGFITLDQFMEAIKIQIKEEMETTEHRLIGQILLELGYMDTSQINEVLDVMGIPDTPDLF